MPAKISSYPVHSIDDCLKDGTIVIPKTNISRFENFFKKLVFGLRLIGIPLNPSDSNTSRILRYWSIGFGLANFSFNVFLNIYYLAGMEKPNSIGRLSILLNAINFSFTLILIHAGLLFITALRWKELMKAIEQIEDLHFFQPEDYEKFRKVVVFACVILLLTVG